MPRHEIRIVEVVGRDAPKRSLRPELIDDLVSRTVALRATEHALGKLPRVDLAAHWFEQAAAHTAATRHQQQEETP